MTTLKKTRKFLLAYARKGFSLADVNYRLKEQCLEPIHSQEWSLWKNYYVDIVKNDPYYEHELIDNNRSLAWFATEMNHRRRNQMIS